jgi:hypothetical protein
LAFDVAIVFGSVYKLYIVYFYIFEAMNCAMTYGIPASAANGNFAINSTTGVITTTVPLNREDRDEWIITGESK